VRAVLFLGGNGHAPIRLQPAREVLRRGGEPFTLEDLPYPRAASFDALLDAVAREVEARASPGATVYATGIGALVALALRARGGLPDHAVVLQGGVLWGLERRWFPRVMRIAPMPRLLAAAFRLATVRRRFAARHFQRTHPPELVDAFFEGYRDARAFAAWFHWLRPALLRRLERDLQATSGALADLRAWWGGRDGVVGIDELRHTERALGIRIPLHVFPEWGHYPMIDDPEGWVREVGRVVATAGALP
jgi:pimeloyl-ACP methyl ester carboxylesterase